MATNEHLHEAENLDLPVASGVKSGDPVQVGAINGVAIIDRQADGKATVRTKGSYHFEVTGAVTQVGTAVYLDGKTVTTTAGEGEIFGYALAEKTAAAASIPVRIAQV